MKLEEAIKSDKFRDAKHQASLNIMYTAWWLKSHISSHLKELGLTAEQFNVMRILKGKDPEAMCVRDIASRMIEKNSNVPRIIDRLVIKKMVKRKTSSEDKRETLIHLTPLGHRQLEIANGSLDELGNAFMGLSEAEARQLNELLEKFRKEEDR